jgi:hypothetical protein
MLEGVDSCLLLLSGAAKRSRLAAPEASVPTKITWDNVARPYNLDK